MDPFEIFGAIFGFIASIIPLIVILFILSRFAKLSKQRPASKGDPNAWLNQQPARCAKRKRSSAAATCWIWARPTRQAAMRIC